MPSGLRIRLPRGITAVRLAAFQISTAKSLAVGVVMAGSVLLGLPNPAVAAPPNQLLNPNVWPSDATTKATFTFAVTYRSAEGNEPSSVSAVVGTTVIPLKLDAGSPANGRYRGSTKLPAGTWKVIFRATAEHRNDPSLSGPTIRVRLVFQPTPSPQTTEPRTPRPNSDEPTRRPQPTPDASAGETHPVGAGIVTLSPRATAGVALGGGAPNLSALGTLVAGALIALALLALTGLSAFLAERRRRRRDERPVLLPVSGRETPASATRQETAARKPATWDRDWALDDTPVGTVEMEAPHAGKPPWDERRA